eukprot:3371960-Pleurochrysis_carterae.AAC.1
MAAAHSGWALDSPASRNPGCCFYCTLPKTSWFDAAACVKAPCRNVYYETCAAHLNPHILYASETSGLPGEAAFENEKAPSCPHCNVKLTADFLAKEMSEFDASSISQQAARALKHRQTYAGKELHAELE